MGTGNRDFRTDKEKKIDLLVDEYVDDEGLWEWNNSFEYRGLKMADQVTDFRFDLERLSDKELNKVFRKFKKRNKDSKWSSVIKGEGL
tara:strand:- start:2084 stop:2347 length:264 start_codon:yes stop_codon:yes gene_type:complete